MGLHNIDRFIGKKISSVSISDERDDISSNSNSSSKGKWIMIIVGIAIVAIGFAGAISYGSQFVKQEANAGAALPYTTPAQVKNLTPIDLELVFVVIGVIGFGVFAYGLATMENKPFDFYPK
ncbi:MAG TPA: hypothetical protein VH796_13660 [Nitrososphaeraceae archaeon]